VILVHAAAHRVLSNESGSAACAIVESTWHIERRILGLWVVVWLTLLVLLLLVLRQVLSRRGGKVARYLGGGLLTWDHSWCLVGLLLELKLELLLLLLCLFLLLQLALDLVVVVRDRVDVEGLGLLLLQLLVRVVIIGALLDAAADLLAILAGALLGGVAAALANVHLLLTNSSWCERAAWQAAGLVVAGERVVHIVDVWLRASWLRGCCGHGLLRLLLHLL